MRTNLFFAIELPEEVRAGLHERARQWEALTDGSGARWYAPEDYHITLKFLGAHEACETDSFAGQAGEIVASEWRRAKLGWIELKIDEPGVFPRWDAPRILWAGMYPPPCLRGLAARLDVSCAGLGIPPETRSFRPHVTLARAREMRGTREIVKPPPATFRGLPRFAATRFVLMQTSPPTEQKSGMKLRYNTVHTFDLL